MIGDVWEDPQRLAHTFVTREPGKFETMPAAAGTPVEATSRAPASHATPLPLGATLELYRLIRRQTNHTRFPRGDLQYASDCDGAMRAARQWISKNSLGSRR
jgi:hypothetical protein